MVNLKLFVALVNAPNVPKESQCYSSAPTNTLNGEPSQTKETNTKEKTSLAVTGRLTGCLDAPENNDLGVRITQPASTTPKLLLFSLLLLVAPTRD